jgi:CRP-like cAMP-binding protein
VKICEFLHQVEPFRHLSPTEVSHVAEQMIKRVYRPDVQIISEGDQGDEFFLMVEGEVTVSSSSQAAGKPFATLGVGEFFGEASLISGEPRNATITSRSNVATYVLDKNSFKEAIDTSETFREQLLKVYFHRQ